MCKRATNAQEETTPDLEVLGNKCSRPSKSDEEFQAAPVMIVVDLMEQVIEASSIFGGATQDAS